MVFEKAYAAKETALLSTAIPTESFLSYAENFDLSLLPCNDGEVPQTLLTDLPLYSPEYLPATIFHTGDVSMKYEVDTGCWPSATQTQSFDTFNQNTGGINRSNATLSSSHVYACYPSPLPSPHHQHEQSLHSIGSINSGNSSPSPSPLYFGIKQEIFSHTTLPPSPPDSTGVPSPRCEIKIESDIDNENCIDIDSLLKNSFEHFDSLKTFKDETVVVPSVINCGGEQQAVATAEQQDHKLLRECLQDTSFQKKHNLKPLALDSLLGVWDSRSDFEPVISLALEHVRQDVQATCAALNIPDQPHSWTVGQVQLWLRATVSQFDLPEVTDLENVFKEDGTALVGLNEAEFLKRLPDSGSDIYAQLEVWKAACADSLAIVAAAAAAAAGELSSVPVPVTVATATAAGATTAAAATVSAATIAGDTEMLWSIDGTHSVEASDDEDDEIMPLSSSSPATAAAPAKVGRQGGSQIHLWEFLKELLASPQANGTAIRWLDRSQGIFKIEDSVRVAKLWGRRKNRPAMNYDKLSRSIRQYYKKGIMKKTERSQRLVYQFCHPYNL